MVVGQPAQLAHRLRHPLSYHELSANELPGFGRVKLKVIVFLLIATASWAEEMSELSSDWDRFRLWNRCHPMGLQVFVNEDAIDIGLTKKTVTAAVRSRLRAARLYENGGESKLWAGVEVHGFAFNVNVYYMKKLMDPVSMQVARAITWQDGSFGTHRQDSGFVLSALSESVDMFIDEYLRVNALVCP